MARMLGVAVVLAATNVVVMASPEARLTTRGTACPVEDLPARVRALLGRDAFDETAAAGVEVALKRSGGAVRAQITFDDADGTQRGPRLLEARSCDSLLDAIALVIAMGLPADAAPPASPPAPPPPPPTWALPSAELDLREASAPVEHSPGNELAITAGSAAGYSVNGWQPALDLGLRWRRAHHSLALELRLDAPDERAVGAVGRLRVSAATLSAVSCRHVSSLALCGAITAGELRGSGIDLFEAREVVAPVLAAGARLGWEHGLWRGVAARVEAGADAVVTTSRFDVDHMTVWTSSPFDAWAGAGMLVRFL